MRARLATILTCGGLALTLLAAWTLELSLERALLLAPAFVLAGGAAVGLLLLWTKVVVESVRSDRTGRRPR